MYAVAQGYSADTRATDFLKKTPNGPFIALEAVQIEDKDAFAGKYYVTDESHKRVIDTAREPGNPAKEVKRKVTLASYKTREHALAQKIPSAFRDPRIVDAALVKWWTTTDAVAGMLDEQIKLGIEADFASYMADTANYGTGFQETVASADQLQDPGSDPRGMAQDAHEAFVLEHGIRPNKVIMGYNVYKHLKKHPQLLTSTEIQGGVLASDEKIKSVLEVPKLFVGMSHQITTLDGAATQTKAQLWGNHLIFLYQPDDNSPVGLRWGWHIARPLEEVPSGQDMIVESMYDWNVIAYLIRVRRSCRFNQVDNKCAYLFKDATNGS